MSALILKSSNALNPGVENIAFSSYKNRVLRDGGVIVDEQAVRDAIDFAIVNKIMPSEVFSATSARWGVKFAAMLPTKLYSLFDESGDISVDIPNPTLFSYNTTRYSYPVLSFMGSSNNALITSGGANNVNSSGMCIITKVPSGTVVGTGTKFTAGDFSDLSTSVSSAVAADKKIHSVFLKRATISNLPDSWTVGATGYGLQAQLDTVGKVADMTKWGHVSTFLTAGRMALYSKGELVLSKTGILEKPYKDNLRFNIGRLSGGTSSTTYSDPFYGDIAEAWCLINTTEIKMQALSLRASQKYID